MSAMMPEAAASQYLQNQRQTLKDVFKIFVQKGAGILFQSEEKQISRTNNKKKVTQVSIKTCELILILT